MNPDSGTKEKLKLYKTVGINRLSIGLQSTEDVFLRALGRLHNYETFLSCYKEARAVGFNNINVDLMFGLPNQKLKDWIQTLDQVIYLSPEHLSCYGLIIEEGTPYYYWSQQGKIKITEETLERKMYHEAIERLKKAGYEHYEISNFAKKNYHCIHNKTYWQGIDYIGFGLGAASYIEKTRFKNTSSMAIYFRESHCPKKLREECQVITQKEQIEEFMFLGLRLIEGISTITFKETFSKTVDEIYGDTLKELEEHGLITRRANNIKLTEKGLDLSNYVYTHFLLDQG